MLSPFVADLKVLSQIVPRAYFCPLFALHLKRILNGCIMKKQRRIKGYAMTVKIFQEKLNLSVINLANPNSEITDGYCCDLLSNAMVKVDEGCCWFTVIDNFNVIAIAVQTKCACVVLCENAKLDEHAKNKAKEHGVNILSTKDNAYSMAVKLGILLNK